MIEGLQAIGAAWSSILHIAEWSGLSLGALAAIAVVVYLEPRLLKPAIIAVIAIALVYGGTIYGDVTGRADEDAKLKIISAEADARAAQAASEDEASRVSAIEQKAKEQHDQDLAEIARLSANNPPDCGFDPDTAGGLRQPSGAGQAAGAVGGKAQPAAGAEPAHEGASAAADRHGLHLPLLWHRRMQGQGHRGDAAAHGQ